MGWDGGVCCFLVLDSMVFGRFLKMREHFDCWSRDPLGSRWAYKVQDIRD
jgi:hypothetical protein